jgi:hypothetical protein
MMMVVEVVVHVRRRRELVAVFGNGFFFLHPALTLLIG